MKKVVLAVFSIFLLNCAIAQEEDPDLAETKYTEQVFLSPQLINAQTTEILPKKSWRFKIQHRFGAVKIDESLYKQFLGLDLPANIRFGFDFSVTDKFYFGFGRTKNGKTIDIEGKYRFLQQTKDNKNPISAAVYFNAAINTMEFPSVANNSFFADSTTEFEYNFYHRLSYNTQLILSRKFSDRISVQTAPVFIWQNLVAANRENYTFALPVSGKIKLGFSSSIIFEYTAVFNNNVEGYNNPASLGIQFGTAGHVFQIILSSTNEILEQDIYTNKTFDYSKGYYTLGFNLKRTFWSKK